MMPSVLFKDRSLRPVVIPRAVTSSPLSLHGLKEPNWDRYGMTDSEGSLLSVFWQNQIDTSREYQLAEAELGVYEGFELSKASTPRHALDRFVAVAEHEGVRVRHRGRWSKDRVLRVGRRTSNRILGRTKAILGGGLAKVVAVALKAFLLQGFAARILEPLLADRVDSLFIASWALAVVLSAGIVWIARLLSHLLLEWSERRQRGAEATSTPTPFRAFDRVTLVTMILAGIICFAIALGAILAFDLGGSEGSAAARTSAPGALALNMMFLAIVLLAEPILAAKWRWHYTDGENERLRSLEKAMGEATDWLGVQDSVAAAATRAFFAQSQIVSLVQGMDALEVLAKEAASSRAAMGRFRRTKRRVLDLASPGVPVRRTAIR